MSVYSMGIYVGSGLTFIRGGVAIQFAAGKADFTLPLLGAVHLWQLAFILVGLPNFLAALLLATVQEPASHGLGVTSVGDTVPLRKAWAYLPNESISRLPGKGHRSIPQPMRHVPIATCGLLDAAHIVADSAEGEPRVSSGLSLCKLHHAAFDSLLVSVTPDYRIQVRPSVLEEEDGLMLEHGLKGLHALVIQLPGRRSDRPDRDGLAVHLERFRRAA